jgi:hypothetical protein
MFTTIDSLSNIMGGLPSGDITTTGTIRTVNELRITPADDGFTVTGILKEIEGSMTTPMGAMPVEATTGTSVEFTVSASGPAPDDMAETVPAPGMASQADILGSSRAVAGLILLPGRVVRMGETWTDTSHVKPEIEGMEMELTIIANGTYEGDTVVDGRTLNVLRLVNETRSKASGTVQGMDMTQDMTINTSGTVLWDSALHIPVLQDQLSDTQTDMTMLQTDMTMRMTARARSITTAQPQG